MDKRVYWIFMQQAFGPGSPKPMQLARSTPGGLEAFVTGGPIRWVSTPGVTDRELAGLRSFSLDEAAARLEYALRVGWRVLTPDDRGYPEALKNIYDPPAALYLRGEMPPVDDRLTVAVVGARKAQKRSLDAARLVGYELALGGACVVSGGALGIDASVLSGALEIPDAKVACVLPVSLDSPYIHRNLRLREKIADGRGALITEYFSQQAPDFGTFPVRNRLITGLSRAVLLVQAAARSGTMLSAKRALEQDRDVMVLAGPAGDLDFAGGQSLIEDGCPVVRGAADIFREYSVLPAGQTPRPDAAPNPPAKKPPAPQKAQASPSAARPEKPPRISDVPEPPLLNDPGQNLSPQCRQLWALLDGTPRPLDELTERSGLSAGALLGLLTQLELAGLARSHPGKRFSRVG